MSNPRHLKTLDIHHLGTPGQTGAHVVKFDKNTNTAAVATYLLWIPGKTCRSRGSELRTVSNCLLGNLPPEVARVPVEHTGSGTL